MNAMHNNIGTQIRNPIRNWVNSKGSLRGRFYCQKPSNPNHVNEIVKLYFSAIEIGAIIGGTVGATIGFIEVWQKAEDPIEFILLPPSTMLVFGAYGAATAGAGVALFPVTIPWTVAYANRD